MKKKMILDCDTGIDDALAIAYAVSLPDVELLGITNSYGMAPVEYTYRNSKKILELLEKDVPVYTGSEQPLFRKKEYNGIIHGMDGLGDTLGPVANPERTEMDAIDYIIEQVHLYKQDLTLVTTGPLTNLARAIQKAPEIVEMVGRVVTMGGAIMTPGNVNKFAEANIYIDPEAAKIVFNSNLPLTLVGLDVTRKTLLTAEDVKRWREKGTKASMLFADFTEHYLNAYKKLHPYLEGCALHDPLAIGVAAYPDLVTTVPLHIDVDLDEKELGRTTEDLHRVGIANSMVSVQVNAKRFMDSFFTHVI